jgi:hypothetical protein
MSEILDVPAEVVNLGEKAGQCIQVAKPEECEAARTVGTSVGYLRLGDRVKSAEAIILQPDEVPPHHG